MRRLPVVAVSVTVLVAVKPVGTEGVAGSAGGVGAVPTVTGPKAVTAIRPPRPPTPELPPPLRVADPPAPLRETPWERTLTTMVTTSGSSWHALIDASAARASGRRNLIEIILFQ